MQEALCVSRQPMAQNKQVNLVIVTEGTVRLRTGVWGEGALPSGAFFALARCHGQKDIGAHLEIRGEDPEMCDR